MTQSVDAMNAIMCNLHFVDSEDWVLESLGAFVAPDGCGNEETYVAMRRVGEELQPHERNQVVIQTLQEVRDGYTFFTSLEAAVAYAVWQGD